MTIPAQLPLTLSQAISKVNPGTVACLGTGTYNTATNIYLSRSGSSTAPVYYRSYNGTATIQYTGGSASGGVLQVTSGASWSGAHDIVIDGLTIDGNNLIGGGIFVTNGAHHVTVRNCIIKNTGATGIAFNATDYATAQNNLIYHAGYNQGWSSGISLWYGGVGGTNFGGATAAYDTAPGFHNVIADNIISGVYDNSSYHTDGNGIIIDGGGSTMPPALIIGNVTYQNGGRGIVTLGNSGNTWVVNNTTYSNGLDLQCGSGQCPDIMAQLSTNAHWVNNIAYGRKNGANYTTAYILNNTSSTIQSTKNLGFNGTIAGGVPVAISADPQFSNRPLVSTTDSTAWAHALEPWSLGTRLTLIAGSPAINAGADPRTVTGMTTDLQATMDKYLSVDVLGHTRYNGAIDIGAYEY
jgi:hypothetical protein